MEFCVLGPLAVRVGTVAVPVSQGKQRAVLAALLLAANRVVSVEELAETLWGYDPPPSARVAVQNHVMRLRKTMGYEGSRVVTQPPGYLIRVGPGELDITRFQTHLDTARTAAREGSWKTTAAEARAALSLFRGEPLADVGSEALTLREIPRLAELRLQALEARIDADLHLGRHVEVIAELRLLTSAHPLRERPHGQLMLALYRAARPAEALSAYQEVHKALVAEIGTEPGAELRELHRQILAADPALALPGQVPTVAEQAGRVVPRELPASVAHFAGRATELAALTSLLDQRDELTPETLVISAIGGAGGVGKTALAVHWAHQAAGRFPDGQLYVNLRGYDADQPVPAADALAWFLRSLGVPGHDIPPEPDQRAARYRSLLAGKRMLIVLDNAWSADQVRPLLPGAPSCAVLVTSRDTLAGLVARDGAARLEVDVLPLRDAIALLRTLIGARVDAEPGAAAELAAQCSRLPLALRVAAELAASRPAVPLAGLVSELADLRTRLDLLGAAGDPGTEVRTVISWSYRRLHAEHARAFRLLGLHPGPDIEPYATAALTGTTIEQARRALDTLARAHLLSLTAPGRYGIHDLLRGYARELTIADTREEQHAALTRLFDSYLHTAATAMDTLYPADRHHRPRIRRPATPVPPPGPAAARDWLDDERAALVAAAGHAAVHGWPGHAIRLAAILYRYLHNGGHYPEAITVFRHALDAARRTGDRVAEATALNQIGTVDWQQGRYQQAADRYREALALFRAAGDRTGEAQALGNLGLEESALGRYEQAAGYQQESVAIHRDLGDLFGEARALSNLGLARQRQGRYQEAAGYHGQSLDLSREIGDRQGEAYALTRLGVIDLRLSRYQHAGGYLGQAMDLFREIGDTGGEADALARLGEAYLRLGRYEQAAKNFEQALTIFREIGDPSMQADALNGLGEVLLRTGDAGNARAHYAAALRLASEAGVPLLQARAHSGLAHARHADGDSVQARHHWRQALTCYTAIGAPEADEIRARLAGTGDGNDGADKRAGEGAPLVSCRQKPVFQLDALM